MMVSPAPFTLAAHAQHLGYWVIIRTLVLLCLGIAVIACIWNGMLALPVKEIIFTLIFMGAINLLTFLRLKQGLPVTELEFFIQLLLDLLCLSAVFYFSGGASNPFVSYFLVPICISAATLNWSYTLIITGTCVTSYSLLLFFNIPLPALSPSHEHTHNAVNLHILGMWLNFFISAGLITYFVVKMAGDLRAQDEQLNRRREDELRDEQLMAVATLAAGTAHELGTPLSTMKLLLGELRAEHAANTHLKQDLDVLSQQVDQCATTLRNLVHKAEQTKDGQFPRESVYLYCKNIIEHWQIVRPEANAHIVIGEKFSDVSSVFHPTIAQAIINLLNNAADANPNNIQITIDWDTTQLRWTIADEGPGIDREIAAQLGKAFISTKTKGLGIGLFLTQATINRYGGTVVLHNRTPLGTLTQLTLPINTAQ